VERLCLRMECCLKGDVLTAIEHRKNRCNPTVRIKDWHRILNPLAILHRDRITIN